MIWNNYFSFDLQIAIIQFSDLPEKWITLRKTAINIKYEIIPIQAYQVDTISKQIIFFNVQTKQFRESFKKMKVSLCVCVYSFIHFVFRFECFDFCCFYRPYFCQFSVFPNPVSARIRFAG